MSTKSTGMVLEENNRKVPIRGRFRYGWCGFHPRWLQRFNKPVVIVFWMCLIVVLQGTVCTGIANVVLTSIETRYGFKATELALFNTFFHVASGIFGPIIAYIGHKHRPRILGLTCLVLSVGLVLVTIPHWISGEYQAGFDQGTELCDVANKAVSCGQESSSRVYLIIMICAYFVMGLGSVPIFLFVSSHIDDISTQSTKWTYFTALVVSAILGPAIGYGLGNVVLKIYVEVTQPVGSNLMPTDSSWVGAWWLGILIGAGLILIPVIPMLGFPSEFPSTTKVRVARRASADSIKADIKLRYDLASIVPAVKGLLKNAPYIFICLSNSAETLVVGGLATFLPKLLETQYHFTAAKSALVTGCIIIPGSAVGIIIGGMLPKRYNWTCKQAMKATVIMAGISTCFALSMLVGCPSNTVVGVDEAYYNSTSLSGVDASCRGSCHCSTKYYKPICADDHRTYFSACHAGCREVETRITIDDGLKSKHYFNCSCFPPSVHHAIEGRCRPECTLFPYFVLLLLLLIAFNFMNNVPFLYTIFRVVPEGQQTFAIGFQQIFSRCLGFLPAPTIFGSLIDMSCKLWHVDECSGETTSCLEYDNKMFRYYILAIGLACKALSTMFAFLAYKSYTSPEDEKIPEFTGDTEAYLDQINAGHMVNSESQEADHTIANAYTT